MLRNSRTTGRMSEPYSPMPLVGVFSEVRDSHLLTPTCVANRSNLALVNLGLSRAIPGLQQVLERLQVGSHLAPDRPLKHRLDQPKEGSRLCLDARCEACRLR